MNPGSSLLIEFFFCLVFAPPFFFIFGPVPYPVSILPFGRHVAKWEGVSFYNKVAGNDGTLYDVGM